MKNFMVEIMEDVMSNRAEKEERKKKLHDLLDKYRDDVRALDGDPGLDGIDFMFAKPYLDEVLEERRIRRERQSVVYDNKSNMGEAFREDIKKRREDGVEKVSASRKSEQQSNIISSEADKDTEIKNIMNEAKRKIENMSAKDWETYKKKMSKSQKIADELLGWMPEYQALLKAKAELDVANLVNGDNYYHRLGMCQLGQLKDLSVSRKRIVSKLLGGMKEINDLYKKVIKKAPDDLAEVVENPVDTIKFILYSLDMIEDSRKDMQNNEEGLNFGLNNSDKSCREWLDGLDWRNNRWK
ncbi:MAG: hypothetical protein J6C85_02460 [Alphaproteobacteria bacterium]|nr:hypothetical protein [Alphaproteobacteria bacterium]